MMRLFASPTLNLPMKSSRVKVVISNSRLWEFELVHLTECSIYKRISWSSLFKTSISKKLRALKSIKNNTWIEFKLSKISLALLKAFLRALLNKTFLNKIIIEQLTENRWELDLKLKQPKKDRGKIKKNRSLWWKEFNN